MNHKKVSASISTMWAMSNYPDLNDFIAVAANLGFEKIELNHQVDSRMLSNLNMDLIQFSSVHEPCPADISTKELVNRDWLISATDEDSRKLGVQSIRNSIDLACKSHAPVVVVHCGNASMNMEYERKLRTLYDRGETYSDQYITILSQAHHTRADWVKSRLEAVKMSLCELIDYAFVCGIKLGLENRYHFMDIPSIDEMDELLSLADSSTLGFIYDVGHAHALDRLGFFPYEEWLKRYSSRIFGTHLHDVIGLSDHLAPGLGQVDFSKISTYIPESAFRTLEIQPGNTLAQVRSGIDNLVNTGCIHYQQ